MPRLFAALLMGTLLALTLSARAQGVCARIYQEPLASRSIDPHYAQTMETWQDGWKANWMYRLIGREAPALPSDTRFSIRDFLQARTFRTWFEAANRRAHARAEKPAPVNARVKLLTDPREALQTKLLAIREAQYTVDMSYFIVRYDEAGLAMLGELQNAIARGVNVRILYDSMGSGAFGAQSPLRGLIDFAAKNAGFTRGLDGRTTNIRATLEVVEFQPVSAMIGNGFREIARVLQNFSARLLGLPEVEALGYSMNRRSHDKILLIDGAFEEKAIAFTGGRNLANEYYDLDAVKETNYTDLEIMMRGVSRADTGDGVSIGAQVQEAFDQIYFHIANRRLARSLLGLTLGYEKEIGQIQAQRALFWEKEGLDENQRELREMLLEDGLEMHKVEIVDTFHNLFRPGPWRKYEISEHRLERANSRGLMKALEKALGQEKEEITLMSPYLWMSPRQLALIKKWLLDDPSRRLRILTNSVLTSDQLLAHILMDAVLGPQLMLDTGVVNAKGQQVRRSVADQVQIYERGHLDSVVLGGTRNYGRLHAKAVYLKSSQTILVGTFNNDPRSLLINSEGAAIIQGAKASADMSKAIETMIQDSHLWGSPEYHQIRASDKLDWGKRMVARHFRTLYAWAISLRLWWLL